MKFGIRIRELVCFIYSLLGLRIFSVKLSLKDPFFRCSRNNRKLFSVLVRVAKR
jgi:hypothetical protein